MGNSGSSIGDIFYPDNPNRRRRAEELRQDINDIVNQFQEQKQLREDVLARIKPKLDKILKDRGFETPDDLERKVREILKGPELENYDKLSATLDKYDQGEGIAWQVISLIAASTGVVIGVAFVAGVVTGGAALALIGTIGEVLAVIGVVIALFGIIEGSIERSNLQDAINQLFPKRLEAKQALEQLRVIANWAQAIETWVNNPTTSDPKLLDKLLSASLDKDYKYWTPSKVYEVLHQWDINRQSWTNEDPEFHPGASLALKATLSRALAPADSKVDIGQPVAKATLKVITEETEGGGEPPVLDLTYQEIIDVASCVAEDENGNSWKLYVVKTDKEAPSLENTFFDVENLSTGRKFHTVRLEVLDTSTN